MRYTVLAHSGGERNPLGIYYTVHIIIIHPSCTGRRVAFAKNTDMFEKSPSPLSRWTEKKRKRKKERKKATRIFVIHKIGGRIFRQRATCVPRVCLAFLYNNIIHHYYYYLSLPAIATAAHFVRAFYKHEQLDLQPWNYYTHLRFSCLDGEDTRRWRRRLSVRWSASCSLNDAYYTILYIIIPLRYW